MLKQKAPGKLARILKLIETGPREENITQGGGTIPFKVRTKANYEFHPQESGQRQILGQNEMRMEPRENVHKEYFKKKI